MHWRRWRCTDTVGWASARVSSMVICLERGASGLHMAQLMPLPLTVSCSSKSRLVLLSWFYLSGTGSPGSSQTKSRDLKMVVVLVAVTFRIVFLLVLLVTITYFHTYINQSCWLCAINGMLQRLWVHWLLVYNSSFNSVTFLLMLVHLARFDDFNFYC